MLNFQSELNPEQYKVVTESDGPCLVLAGAGSGKTRVITYRVAYLLERGVKPENILLVTFTNKAAAEMADRVRGLISSDSPLAWSGTFHHIANKILRYHASLLGYENNFTILDSEDSQSLIKLCAKGLPSEQAGQKFPSAGVLQNVISYARNALVSIEEALDARCPQWLGRAQAVKFVADDYSRRKKEANAMDFDDLLVNLLLLFNFSEALDKYADQFQYILVDEYQDTNKIQAAMVEKLAVKHGNILAVGDDAQSIYSFRAADIQNILRFSQRHPEARVFKLETNYRSSQEILDLANSVIANNSRQYRKELRTLVNSGLKPALYPRQDQLAEAAFIVEKIGGLINSGVPAKDIAVLFRAAHHSQMLEMALMKAGIDYDYRGGLRFFERAHIKDVLSYLRLVNNLSDGSAWMRVLTLEEGIGAVGARRIAENIKMMVDAGDIRQAGYEILSGRARDGWNNFVGIWEALIKNEGRRPAELIRLVKNSAYGSYLASEYMDNREREQDIEQLAAFAARYEDLGQFLAETALQEAFNLRGAAKDKIILSTIHQAKGLEWTAVFVINLANGAFPNDLALREDGGAEEERRLFYVAITRAKRHLYLTYPMSGRGAGDFLAGPSMFLSEIGGGLLDDHSLLDYHSVALDDDEAGVHYVFEDNLPRIKPGSFLIDIEDL